MDTVIASVTRACSLTAIASSAHRVLEARVLASDPFGRAVLEHRSAEAAAETANTLSAANDEAVALLADGNAAAAVVRLTEVAGRCAAELGPDHPDVLVVRGNLATARVAARQFQRAVDDARAVLDDRERVLGPHHPSTVNAGLALGMAHLAAGDTAEACAVLDTAMVVIECLRHGEHHRHRGDDHPLLRFCRALLADARAAAPA